MRSVRGRAAAACPVVGIGASAGGLDALRQFFQAASPSSGAAFVVIQHLDPTHESLTAELLSLHTSMSVVQVTRPVRIEPNRVYVIPPNKYLAIENRKLRLIEPTERRGLRMPVDFFLRTLAAARMERAIGIVLSGTGTDGTLGLKEIKAYGGLTIAQDPVSAQYDSMPRSCINSGSVDRVLTVAQMPGVIGEYIRNEELETSKEELQSLNQELSTVNSQLEAKVTELEHANDDMNNLLVSTELATLFLDTRFQIRRFTPAMTRLLRLIPTDIGRPITDFASPIVAADLLDAARAVLERLAPVESEIETNDGHWYLRRALPYRAEINRIDGVVVTFIDISTRKRAEAEITRLNEDLEHRVTERTEAMQAANRELISAHDRLEAIFKHSADGIVTITSDGIIDSFNPAAEDIFGYSAQEIVGRPVAILMAPPFDREHTTYLRRYLETGVARVIGTGGREVQARRKDGSTFPLDLRVGEVRSGDQRLFVGTVRDLTEQKRAAAELRELTDTLSNLVAEERRRIGMALHDQIGQMLVGGAMLARSLGDRLRGQGSPHADDAMSLADQMREAHIGVRELARGLVPVPLTDGGLDAALADLAERTQKAYKVECAYEGRLVDLPDEIEVSEHLYWIAQEAVSNAVRHARPRHVWISLKDNTEGIVLTVRDDGSAAEPAAEPYAGIGIRIMRHRASLIGARLEVQRAEEGGTVVRCVMPSVSTT